MAYDPQEYRDPAAKRSGPDVRFDTGSGLPGPGDPVRIPPIDGDLLDELRVRLDAALHLREAHAAELDRQQAFHREQMDRAQRAIEACNLAIGALDPEERVPPDLGAAIQSARVPR